MTLLKCQIPASDKTDRAAAPRRTPASGGKMVPAPLQRSILDLKGIPTLPVFVQELLMTIQADDFTARDLEAIIRKDPALAARLLRVANSSFFGRSGRVKTLEQAVVLLGVRFIQALALSISLVDTLDYENNEGPVPWQTFWLHSFACAWISHRLVQEGASSEARDSAFISGLLHDLGKPFLWIHQAKPYQEVIWAILETGRETHEAEQQTFGMHHGEIGGELARWWKLPETVQTAIACHHEESRVPEAALLVQVADYIAHRAGFADGLRAEGSLPHVSPEWLADPKAQLVKELVDEVAAQPQELQEVVRLLQST